jgi:hypothetical protein
VSLAPWLGVQPCNRCDQLHLDGPECGGRTADEADLKAMTATPELIDALVDLLAMLDAKILVRNIANDADPDWHIRSIKLVMRLKAVQNALDKAGTPWP